MGTTFLKRQKEMKRLDKQKMKAERREQKKLANRAGIEEGIEGEMGLTESTEPTDSTDSTESPESTGTTGATGTPETATQPRN